MAYVLGFFYADGHMIDAPYMRGKYVCFSNTDKDRLEAIKELLRSEHKIVTLHKRVNYKTAYILRIGSAVIYSQLFSLGLRPHKSLTIAFPNVPSEFQADFIRGYLDGDGCVFLEKSSRNSYKRLQTIFTCGSKKFLLSLHEILRESAGVRSGNVYVHGSSKTAYQLRFNTRDSLRLFSYLYKSNLRPELYLKRKYAIFNEYLRAKNLTVDSVASILETKGPVAK